MGLLGLDPKITKGQTIRVSYRDPTDGDDQAAIQDVAGNDAASFTDYPVRQASQLHGPPTNLTATAISATQIDLAWEAPKQIHARGLPDRGVRRWRHDLERPGGRHRVDRHRLLAHGAERW